MSTSQNGAAADMHSTLRCGHQVSPDDIMVRVQGNPKDFLICQQCWRPGERYHVGDALVTGLYATATGEATLPSRCVGCFRRVIRGSNDRLRYITCSKYCTVRSSKIRHGFLVPVAVKPCRCCGALMSKRSERPYCSRVCEIRATGDVWPFGQDDEPPES